MYNRPHRANPSRDENLTENGERTPQHSGRFDGAHAAAWHKWFHIMEDAAQPVSDLMVERAGLAPGHRVLDVATGLGEPAIAAAPDSTDGLRRGHRHLRGHAGFRPRPGGRARCHQYRVQAHGCRGGWPVRGRLRRRAVLLGPHVRGRARFGPRGAARMPGAGRMPGRHRLGSARGRAGLGLAARVVLESLGMAPPDEGAKTPFALADVAALERRFENAGLAQIRGEWMTVTFHLREPRTICRLPQGPLPPPHGQYRQPTGGAPGGGVGGRGGGGGALHRP